MEETSRGEESKISEEDSMHRGSEEAGPQQNAAHLLSSPAEVEN